MNTERKVNIEGLPLNTSGAANIFLNRANTSKTSNGTVIHLNAEKSADVGVHINTTLSIASSKKVKIFFIVNFLLSVTCMVVSCSVVFYCWNELISMRKQIDVMKDHFISQTLRHIEQPPVIPEQSYLVSTHKTSQNIDFREPRMSSESKEKSIDIPHAKSLFVANVEQAFVLNSSKHKSFSGVEVVQFNGNNESLTITKDFQIKQWAVDADISSPTSEHIVELNPDHFIVKETGLYMIYAQLVFVGNAPTCYFVWAHKPGQATAPRHLASCSTGGGAGSLAELPKTQTSCPLHVVARLQSGEQVTVFVREPHRTLWLRPGYSYIGFIKLSS